VAVERQITCVECGTRLTVPSSPEDPAQRPKLKVSCRSCGRINDVPQDGTGR
jgi:ribosomal protein S27E